MRKIVRNCEERFHCFNNMVPDFWNVLPEKLSSNWNFKAGLERILYPWAIGQSLKHHLSYKNTLNLIINLILSL